VRSPVCFLLFNCFHKHFMGREKLISIGSFGVSVFTITALFD